MGRIDGRLRRLEERVGTSPTEHERTIGRELLRRMSDEDLDAYEAALICHEAGAGVHVVEDRTIVARVEALYEEVRDGVSA